MPYLGYFLAAKGKRKLEKTTNTQRKARDDRICNIEGVGRQWGFSMQTGFEF